MRIRELISRLEAIEAKNGDMVVISDGFYDLRAPVIETNQDLPPEWDVPKNFVRLRIND